MEGRGLIGGRERVREMKGERGVREMWIGET